MASREHEQRRRTIVNSFLSGDRPAPAWPSLCFSATREARWQIGKLAAQAADLLTSPKRPRPPRGFNTFLLTLSEYKQLANGPFGRLPDADRTQILCSRVPSLKSSVEVRVADLNFKPKAWNGNENDPRYLLRARIEDEDNILPAARRAIIETINDYDQHDYGWGDFDLRLGLAYLTLPDPAPMDGEAPLIEHKGVVRQLLEEFGDVPLRLEPPFPEPS